MSVANEEDTQNFEFPYQGAPKDHKIDMTNHEIYGEIRAQADSIKNLNGDSVCYRKRIL